MKNEVRYIVTDVASIPVYKLASKTGAYRQAAKPGWKMLKALQHIAPEAQEEMAVEMVSAAREINQLDAESDRRHGIASIFCKAFERAVLLDPSEENVRIWVECTRMRPDELEDSIKEADELAEVFTTIANVLRKLGPKAGNIVLP